MSAEDRPRRDTATPQQAGVVLGSVALGCAFALTSSLPQGIVVGLASGAAAYGITRWQSAHRSSQG